MAGLLEVYPWCTWWYNNFVKDQMSWKKLLTTINGLLGDPHAKKKVGQGASGFFSLFAHRGQLLESVCACANLNVTGSSRTVLVRVLTFMAIV